ncbi:hypothetical protein [Mariniradius saccharolyticus]|uniref:hypothetical protein n=1 Tax=Mariniradius saccharolyticus TaxID=1245591 RepID=UPI0012F624C4|nr:hypothetical protein [Mariniradius saccharolyticus]
MIDNLDKYVTRDNLDINWRFEDKKEILTQIKILDRKAYDLIWEKLFHDNIVGKFTLNEDKFKTFEAKDFNNDYNWITARLHEFKNKEDDIILIWADGQALLTNFQTFIENWDDFYYPSSDDLLIINSKRDWIINLTHYECFRFGQGIG